MDWVRRAVVVVVLVVASGLLTGCTNLNLTTYGSLSDFVPLSDGERVWCTLHEDDIFRAYTALYIPDLNEPDWSGLSTDLATNEGKRLCRAAYEAR